MALKLYFDVLSQPSRALFIALKVAGVPFESCPVALRKGEQFSEEFEKVNRFKKVPAIVDNDFNLSESIAILRYLAREKNIPDNLYPKDSRKQAKIDEFLEWQHLNVRAHCGLYFQKKWLHPILFGETLPENKLKPFLKNMIDCLDNMESLWLSQGPYIVGDKLSAADIWAACEVEQPRMGGYDPAENRPILAAWLERIRKETNPYYDEAHFILNKVAKKSIAEEKSKSK